MGFQLSHPPEIPPILRVVSQAGEKVESPSFIPCFRGHKSASSSHFVPLIIIFIIIITAVRLVTKKTILAFFVSLSLSVCLPLHVCSVTRAHTRRHEWKVHC